MRGFGMNQLNYTHRHDGKEPTRKQTKRVHDVHALALFLAASQLFFVGLRRPSSWGFRFCSDFAVLVFWNLGSGAISLHKSWKPEATRRKEHSLSSFAYGSSLRPLRATVLLILIIHNDDVCIRSGY